MKKMFWAALCVAGLVALGGCSSSDNAGGGEPEKQAPDVFKVNFDTSRGTIVVEVHRDWAPHGVDHLYYLVKHGYYDGNKFFRVVRNFCAQFGVNGDPKKTAMWGNTQIPDDVPMHDNTLGTLTFAATGAPNSRTT